MLLIKSNEQIRTIIYLQKKVEDLLEKSKEAALKIDIDVVSIIYEECKRLSSTGKQSIRYYQEENLMDATTYTITIRSLSSNSDPSLQYPGLHKVSCYGKCPEKVVEIRNKIKELWGKEILEIGV